MKTCSSIEDGQQFGNKPLRGSLLILSGLFPNCYPAKAGQRIVNPVPKSLGGVRWSFEDDEITFRTATEEEVADRLIHFANEYAKENGFDRTYIPSEHIGLYEKYGCRYLKDIVNLNYGNGKDRLYVKEIK